ncbi:uncharacterized protein LOC109805207 [Cajanus cajan]|uniref:uncharacterized protein LOC109805207 n=1 Tax=Cajanus cajan TaxID=3821 RepID=UPI00098D7B5C|nr:uncharacterized protein LOC109805207 [Cajanus cajan]
MCKTDVTAHAEVVERGRIFKFLHGLNHEYDLIRVQILGREKLSSLSEVFFMVREEETRRAIMLDGGISNVGFAMTTRKGVHKGANARGKSFEKGNRGDYCSYYRRSGHTKETCFKLQGRNNVLECMGNNKESTQRWANHTTSKQEVTNQSSTSPPSDLNMKAYKEELECLKAMVESISKPSGSCTLSMKDLVMAKTILTAKEHSGLYLLESEDQSKTKIISQQTTFETWANSQIWLHHKRLGHPSFNLIKFLFPHLFTREFVESFNCDIC